MCTMSMIGDFYRDKWTQAAVPMPGISYPYSPPLVAPPVTREEFNALRRDVLEMKELLKRAKEYDERNGEPNCEMDEKMEILRKVAKLVGVSLDDVTGKPAP